MHVNCWVQRNSISPDSKRQKGQMAAWGVCQHTKARANLQPPLVSQVPVRHLRVHASILALVTLNSLQLMGFPPSSYSFSS